MSGYLTTDILSQLCRDDTYARKVLPYLKTEYFKDQAEQTLFKMISGFITDYNEIPKNKTTLRILLDKQELSTDSYKKTQLQLDNLFEDVSDLTENTRQFLIDSTENFCRERSAYLAVLKSIDIMDGKDNKNGLSSIPKILEEAVAVSFDTAVGHDLLEDADSRYEYLHQENVFYPCHIDMFNKIWNGGLQKKTLNVVVAPTGKGKSLTMVHLAADYIKQGFNVLYISLEMSEQKIANRLDANLLDIQLDQLKQLSKNRYLSRVNELKNKSMGRLIIKEYPPTTASAAHYRHLLTELRTKKNFKPDIVFIDYINLCASVRIKSYDSSYTYVKSIAEEIRGLAVQMDFVCWTATQSTRSTQNASDFDLEEVSESHGLSATADTMLAMITTEQLEQMGLVRYKQLKNRDGNLFVDRSFMVGIERAKMKLFNVDQNSVPGGGGGSSEPQQPDRPTNRFGDNEKGQEMFARNKGGRSFDFG